MIAASGVDANGRQAQVFPGVADREPMRPEQSPKPAVGPDVPATSGPTAGESLAAASARLVQRHSLSTALFRVVEVTLDADGRLARRGKIWHADLSMVRRFGRALAANSDAKKVEVSDAKGKVMETLVSPPAGSPPAGWVGWRSMPLPPMPPALPAFVRRAAPRPAVPPPVLRESLMPEDEVETMRTL